VAGHIFQARPVWIYTQSNITNIIFTWVHNTNTDFVSMFQMEVFLTTPSCVAESFNYFFVSNCGLLLWKCLNNVLVIQRIVNLVEIGSL
jgi:hypothetical protein